MKSAKNGGRKNEKRDVSEKFATFEYGRYNMSWKDLNQLKGVSVVGSEDRPTFHRETVETTSTVVVRNPILGTFGLQETAPAVQVEDFPQLI